MSDLNDLIHTNAVIAFQQGEQRERQRIIKLLPDIIRLGNIDYLFDIDDEMPELVQEAKALIDGEHK